MSQPQTHTSDLVPKTVLQGGARPYVASYIVQDTEPDRGWRCGIQALRWRNGRQRPAEAAIAADQGETTSLQPSAPSGPDKIRFGQAKLIGRTPCSTTSSSPAAASAASTSAAKRMSAVAPSGPETSIRGARQIVTFFYSTDGAHWTRHGVRSEVSGYNANTVDDLAQLRPALFAAGKGEVRFRDFRYRALP